MVRPEAVSLGTDADGADATIAQATFVGGVAQYVVRVGEQRLLAIEPMAPGAALLPEGSRVRVSLRAELLRAFPA